MKKIIKDFDDKGNKILPCSILRDSGKVKKGMSDKQINKVIKYYYFVNKNKVFSIGERPKKYTLKEIQEKGYIKVWLNKVL